MSGIQQQLLEARRLTPEVFPPGRGGNWREQRTLIGRRAAGLYSRDSYRPVYAQVLSRLGLEVRKTAAGAD